MVVRLLQHLRMLINVRGGYNNILLPQPRPGPRTLAVCEVAATTPAAQVHQPAQMLQRTHSQLGSKITAGCEDVTQQLRR